jgi:hypothetical protein
LGLSLLLLLLLGLVLLLHAGHELHQGCHTWQLVSKDRQVCCLHVGVLLWQCLWLISSSASAACWILNLHCRRTVAATILCCCCCCAGGVHWVGLLLLLPVHGVGGGRAAAACGGGGAAGGVCWVAEQHLQVCADRRAVHLLQLQECLVLGLDLWAKHALAVARCECQQVLRQLPVCVCVCAEGSLQLCFDSAKLAAGMQRCCTCCCCCARLLCIPPAGCHLLWEQLLDSLSQSYADTCEQGKPQSKPHI